MIIRVLWYRLGGTCIAAFDSIYWVRTSIVSVDPRESSEEWEGWGWYAATLSDFCLYLKCLTILGLNNDWIFLFNLLNKIPREFYPKSFNGVRINIERQKNVKNWPFSQHCREYDQRCSPSVSVLLDETKTLLWYNFFFFNSLISYA